MNRYLICIISLIGSLSSCENLGKRESGNTAVSDSLSLLSVKPNVVNEDAEEGDELKAIVNDFEKIYNDTIFMDTIFKRNAENFHVRLKHYATKDNFIILPEKYSRIYRLKNYKAYEFVSSLRIDKGDSTLIDTLLVKGMFQGLPLELKDYGLLLFPKLYIHQDNIKVGYSISIPLTDVGRSFSASIDYEGNIICREE